jgi:hypothetical protein
MIEETFGLDWATLYPETVFHHQDDVNVIGRRLVRHKASEDNQTIQIACSPGQSMDMQQPSGNKLALLRTGTKVLDEFIQRGWINTWG